LIEDPAINHPTCQKLHLFSLCVSNLSIKLTLVIVWVFFVVMELMAMITQVLNEMGWSVETLLVHVCMLPVILSSYCAALN